MTYSEESLGQNEKLIYEAHFHPFYYAAAWVSAIFCMALAIGALIYTAGIAELGLLCISAAGLAVVAYLMRPIWTTEIAVTNHRVVIKRGWLTRSTTELQLKNIEQVNFHQGLLGRMFDFGKIVIHGTGVDDLILPNIARPVDLVKAIEDASIPVKQPPLAPSEKLAG
ncbi:MAG: PH domain-containing protein [Rhodomicrobium sp.]